MGGRDGGMMSQADMGILRQAGGDKAARLFLTGMIAHHKGAIAMAKTETASGQNPAAKRLAGTITTSQQAEIATMNKLLADL